MSEVPKSSPPPGRVLAMATVMLGTWAWFRAARRSPALAIRTHDRLAPRSPAPVIQPAGL